MFQLNNRLNQIENNKRHQRQKQTKRQKQLGNKSRPKATSEIPLEQNRFLRPIRGRINSIKKEDVFIRRRCQLNRNSERQALGHFTYCKK